MYCGLIRTARCCCTYWSSINSMQGAWANSSLRSLPMHPWFCVFFCKKNYLFSLLLSTPKCTATYVLTVLQAKHITLEKWREKFTKQYFNIAYGMPRYAPGEPELNTMSAKMLSLKYACIFFYFRTKEFIISLIFFLPFVHRFLLIVKMCSSSSYFCYLNIVLEETERSDAKGSHFCRFLRTRLRTSESKA